MNFNIKMRKTSNWSNNTRLSPYNHWNWTLYHKKTLNRDKLNRYGKAKWIMFANFCCRHIKTKIMKR
jgi:hypothetical protein